MVNVHVDHLGIKGQASGHPKFLPIGSKGLVYVHTFG